MNQITEYAPTQVYNGTDPEFVSGSSPGVGKTLLMKIQNGLQTITQSINEFITEYNSRVTVERTATLTTTWSGSAAPYAQTVTISGVTSFTKGVIGLPDSATAAQREAARKAILSISAKGTDSVTISADGEKPTVSIPILLQIFA